MTLIAAFEPEPAAPILIGDLLLSGPTGSGRPISTPLVHDPNSLRLGSTSELVGTTQKIVLLSDQVCVAWAGNYLHARSFLRYLQTHVEGRFTCESLRKHAMSYEGPYDVEYILYSLDGRNRGVVSNLVPFEIDCLKALRVGGTGTANLISLVPSICGNNPQGDLSDYASIGARAVAYVAMASAQQAIGGVGIAEGWGGGFEIAALHGPRFEKLDKILWLRWILIETAPHRYTARLVSPYVYQFYVGRDVCFLVGNSDPDPTRLLVVTSPISSTQITYDLRQLLPRELSPRYMICLVQRVGRSETNVGVIVRRQRAGFPDFKIRYAASENMTSLRIDANFFGSIVGALPEGATLDRVEFQGFETG